MPKIVIKEYDQTSAGIGLYSNFTVLVPGFVGDKYDETKFDDNKVYEISTVKDFLDYVGKKPAQEGIAVEAKAPTITGSIFQYEEGSDSDSDSEEERPEITWIKAILNNLNAGERLYEANVNTTGEIGKYSDADFVYGELDREYVDDHPDYEVIGKYYAIIKDADLGTDAETGTQYGNQIAYELLKLGYTVLFKKLDTIADLADDDFWSPMKDKSIYDFRYVINGLLAGNEIANSKIKNLANFINNNPEGSGRGDCTALCDIGLEAYTDSEGEPLTQAAALVKIEAAAKRFEASKYAALFAPFVVYNIANDDIYANKTFPASFHYLACAAKAAENYNEWYAIAGYTRGVCQYGIESVGCKLGEEAVNALEPRWTTANIDKAVNIIVKIKNNYYLWGNRTAEQLGTKDSDDGDLRASHFLNIRQLCTSIKKQVYITCRKYTFDPNSDLLWNNFCNDIRPLLEKMKADQGITDYKFVKINTKEKGILKAKIRIVPIEAVEDFDISLTLEDSITGTATEIRE